ncbi:Leucine rich repeat containing 15 [Cichlidogyrus casuarinus]|uniref:Leucine rich repeat containing 15 n=1 Tax=Cichlidogyrus casuarinus TaxID=1844966 RepID=A0ABD2PVW1_9PLAT
MTLVISVLALLAQTVSTCPINCRCNESDKEAFCCVNVQRENSRWTCPWRGNSSSKTSETNCRVPWKSLTIELHSDNWPPTVKDKQVVPYADSCVTSLNQLIIRGRAGDSSANLGPLYADHIIKHIFLRNKPVHLLSLQITGTRFTGLDSGFMDRLDAHGIREVEITENSLMRNLGVGWLVGREQLQILNLRGNAISDLDLVRWGLPRRHRQLAKLDASANRISRIALDAFKETPNLGLIALDDNMITRLSADTFTGLSNLTVLSLKRNKLSLTSLDGSLHSPHGPKQLLLSGNPLMQHGKQHSWWLSSGCPDKLQKLELISTGLSGDNLPPISFAKCASLGLVNLLGHEHELRCLAREWLGLSAKSEQDVLPIYLQIFIPNTLKLCAPTTRFVTTSFPQDLTMTTTTKPQRQLLSFVPLTIISSIIQSGAVLQKASFRAIIEETIVLHPEAVSGRSRATEQRDR